eukprot:1425432-Pyramimonas_sp.AAC.1
MYRAPRRLVWLQATSYSVAVDQGVMPGCKYAMALVQLLMLSAMDDFVAAVHPLQGNRGAGFSSSLDVFAGDLTLQAEAQLKFLQQMSVDVIKLLCESLTDL